jgi:hypothetical protein
LRSSAPRRRSPPTLGSSTATKSWRSTASDQVTDRCLLGRSSCNAQIT